MNVSLPIKIFEPRSMLEKIASEFRFISAYLDKAMKNPHPLERMKIVLTYIISSMQLDPQMLKPFNPILGETFQCTIGGYEVALEQISHHPPVSAFQIWSETIRGAPTVDGKLEYEANTGFSSITGYKHGQIRFFFPDTDS